MKKNYTTLLLTVILSIVSNFAAFAQPTANANDDIVSVPTGAIQTVITNVLANDSLYYDHADLSNVILTPLTSSTPGIQLNADGSVAITQAGLAVGSYTLTYQICDIADANTCDIGNITVFIGVCVVGAPIVPEYVYLNCNSVSLVTVYNLPDLSAWTLRISKDGVFLTDVSGVGTSTTSLFISSPGIYTFYVLDDGNGCMSPQTQLIATDVTCGVNLYYYGNYFDFNANGFVDAGDTINYVFSISNNSGSAVTNINLTSPNINVSATQIPILNSNAIDGNNPLGTHVITQSEIDAQQVVTTATAIGMLNGNSVTDNCTNTVSLGTASGIAMSAFIDTNGNGIKDPGEINCPFGKFHYEKNDDGNIIDLWNNGYVFINENNPANTYDISYSVDGNYAAYYSVSTTNYNDVSVSGSGVTHYRFPVSVLPYNDLEVSLYAGSTPRPGFVYSNTVVLRNMSNLPVASATVAFSMDGAVTLIETNPADITPNANGFTYNFTNLMPYESRTILVQMQVPAIPTVALGQQISNSVTLTTPASEIDLANNNASFTATVIGSYDPNDKTESHGGKIIHSEFGPSDRLTYTIRFENTGTAEALNVKVVDVLESKLDETTISMLDASHDYVLERNGNNLIWRFNGINLPPSVANSNVGHGYIIFQVKPKVGYEIGDIIANTADIFFDFNPAIVTNTVTTEFVAALGVAEFDSENFAIYPNPTKNFVNVVMKNGAIENITVNDMLGKTLSSQSVNANAVQIDLSKLSKGLYFIKINTNGKQQTFKVIKE